jgi:DNA polymerase III delta subunit
VGINRKNAKKYGVKKLKDICDLLYNAEYGIKSGKQKQTDALWEAVGLIIAK